MPEMLTGPFPWDDPAVFKPLASLHIRQIFVVKASLLCGFLGLKHRAALVLSALGAGAMGKLLLVAVRALRQAGRGEEVVGAAIGGAARRVAPFRIRHGAIPFAFPPRPRPQQGPDCLAARAEHLNIQFFEDFIRLRSPESASQRGSD